MVRWLGSRLRRGVVGVMRWLMAPRMLYGYRRHDGVYLDRTRMSSTVVVQGAQGLDIANDVFVWHHTILDASYGLTIGTGCQIGSYVSILTHSTHAAIRINGDGYYGAFEPPGYVKAPTTLGEYVFVGPHAVISPGAQVGRGVLIKAYSLVVGTVPDFAIVEGQPAKVVGDTRRLDASLLKKYPTLEAAYRRWAGDADVADAVVASVAPTVSSASPAPASE